MAPVSDHNHHITSVRVVKTLAGTGIIGVFAAGMLSIASDAKIAIKVAEQHGEELLMIRGELTAIRQEMIERTELRYTSRDAEASEKYIERRFDVIEAALEKLE